jgi:hypothetical protein
VPYLAFDLNALDDAPNVARAGSITEDTAIAGLARMWRHCWAKKTDRVDGLSLKGFFGADLGPVLVRFGFLEDLGTGTYRVRGAERYLRISQAQSEAGKKASGNLKRGHLRAVTDPGGQPAVSRGGAGGRAGEEPGGEPERTSGSAPALTPSIEHRTSSIEQEKKAPPPSLAMMADDLVALEEVRARWFGTPPHPLPIPGFEERWQAVLDRHQGDRGWALQTFRYFLEDPWVQGLRPPGSVQVFLGPEQWPKHIRPRVEPPEPCLDCGIPTTPRMGARWSDDWLCYPCIGKRQAAADEQQEAQDRANRAREGA